MLYRDLIAFVVKIVVERMEQSTAETIDKILQKRAYNSVSHDALQDMILKEFTYLHKGNVGRYGLTSSQYYRWKT